MNSFFKRLTTKTFWSGTLVRFMALSLLVWFLCMALLLIGEAHRGTLLGWGLIIPFAILLFGAAFRFTIPYALKQQNPLFSYAIRTGFAALLSCLPVNGLILLFVHRVTTSIYIILHYLMFQVFIILPVAWIAYKFYNRKQEEVVELKKELDQTHASFDFLQAQINPHFLFNALNTLYGTAIAEDAERTGEGIQKLGDMMRFMLHENMEKEIPLSRELEYLDNYISLQKLRTDDNLAVNVHITIDEPIESLSIAPMLLIPFVENAFKHGISLRKGSPIDISLKIAGGTLYFDVHNSKHKRMENDPGRTGSGIGLSNVKQRLHLLYKDRHELAIRETGEDFSVHLTISLT